VNPPVVDPRDLDDLETEILQEKAETLLRISRTLSSHLEELARIGRDLSGSSGEARCQAVARYNRCREDARLWFWYLRVQREAVGFRRNDGLEEYYPIPGPVTE
jgi:hypothetical protein